MHDPLAGCGILLIALALALLALGVAARVARG